jgi:hypothetical protein
LRAGDSPSASSAASTFEASCGREKKKKKRKKKKKKRKKKPRKEKGHPNLAISLGCPATRHVSTTPTAPLSKLESDRKIHQSVASSQSILRV